MIQARISCCACRTDGIADGIVEVRGFTPRVRTLVVDRTTFRQYLAVGQDYGVHLDVAGGHMWAGGVARRCNGEVDDVRRRGGRASSPEIHHARNVTGR